MDAMRLLREMTEDERLFGHYNDDGMWVPPEGVDEANLKDWLDRARKLLAEKPDA